MRMLKLYACLKSYHHTPPALLSLYHTPPALRATPSIRGGAVSLPSLCLTRPAGLQTYLMSNGMQAPPLR